MEETEVGTGVTAAVRVVERYPKVPRSRWHGRRRDSHVFCHKSRSNGNASGRWCCYLIGLVQASF